MQAIRQTHRQTHAFNRADPQTDMQAITGRPTHMYAGKHLLPTPHPIIPICHTLPTNSFPLILSHTTTTPSLKLSMCHTTLRTLHQPTQTKYPHPYQALPTNSPSLTIITHIHTTNYPPYQTLLRHHNHITHTHTLQIILNHTLLTLHEPQPTTNIIPHLT